MATSKRTATSPEHWEFNHDYINAEDEPIKCGQQDCAIGLYTIAQYPADESTITSFSPACRTCAFAGDLSAVFNPEEPRYQPGAPEDFKRGAARILLNGINSPIDTIRRGRPETAAMIEDHAKE